ncbi:MAG: type I DNA topoisomerase [Polyangiaceae bacterium]
MAKAASKSAKQKVSAATAKAKVHEHDHSAAEALDEAGAALSSRISEASPKGKDGVTLVVVESPTKAKTLKKYLGSGYDVLASKGHIKDLPKKMGIDIAHDFQETYQIIEGKEKVVAEIKGAAAKASKVFLATDPDREGEAIAMHIAEELEPLHRPTQRVLFHEITKRGVADGIAHPLALNENLYEAQRTRRVLDRIVGYDVSSLVWNKVSFGLSAGRVQSVALRLIVDREAEIDAFVPVEYWNIGVTLLGTQKPSFFARLVSAGDGTTDDKIEVSNGDGAEKVKADLEAADFSVKAITRKEQRRHAPAPYTTSKLQQDATSYLHFSAKRTMQIAQALYEGVDLGSDGGPVGLITYMRTDSVRVSEDAVTAVRDYIEKTYGKGSMPEKPNVFKSKKSAQDAHEAIRPSSMDLTPAMVQKHLKDEQYKLYKLIWDRFVASQMASAVYDQTSVDVEAKVGRADRLHAVYGLRATGRVLKVAGWLDQYGKGLDSKTHLAGEDDDAEGKEGAATGEEGESREGQLPVLAEGEGLSRVDPPGVLTEQKFTQPPARFNEGSLVRELEKRGIGRPSTYADIISKVQARDYVEKLPGGAFKPTDLGRVVVNGLVRSKLDFIDPNFTAEMEEELDEVEAGTKGRVALLSEFYKKFREQLDAQKGTKKWTPAPEDTGEICPNCGTGHLQKRWSKNGWFIGCSNYGKSGAAQCKYVRNLDANGEEQAAARPTVYACEKCGNGTLMFKSGRYGEFLGCSHYPRCDATRPVPLLITCPKCSRGELLEVKSKKKGSRTFWGCSNFRQEGELKCDFTIWQRPVREPCPQCGAAFLVQGGTKAAPARLCIADNCGYVRKITAEEAEKALHSVPDEIFLPEGQPLPGSLLPAKELPDAPASSKGRRGKAAAAKAENSDEEAQPKTAKATAKKAAKTTKSSKSAKATKSAKADSSAKATKADSKPTKPVKRAKPAE